MTNINFATATTEELAAAGFTTKTLRTRKPRKGELVCERVGGAKTAYRPSIKMGNGGSRHIKG